MSADRDETRPLLEGQNTTNGHRNGLSAQDDGAPKQTSFNTDISRRDFVWILAGLWSTCFLGSLDSTVVATLLTPIGSYFRKSDQVAYLGTSYLLSVCCFTPLYGRLSDILGRKGALLLAVSAFTTGTILCGVAPSMEMLIVARTIAGIGGGGVMTVGVIIMTDIIPLKQRGLWQGMGNIVFGVGAGLGGPLGGFMNDHFGWRSAFLIQIPFLLMAMTIIFFKVNIKLPDAVAHESASSKLKRIDFLGSATLVGAVSTLLLGVSIKASSELPWAHPAILGLLGGSVGFALLFVATEARWSSHPVMPLGLVARRTPAAVAASSFFGSMTAFSMLYNLPLYFQAVRLETASHAGLRMLPNSAALMVGSVGAGWLMRRTGRYYRLTLAASALTVLTNVVLTTWGDSTPSWHLWVDVVGQGAGYAGVLTTTLIAMIATVGKEEMAVATGITYLFRYTGQVLGVSLTGALLQSILLTKLRERITGPGAAELIDRIRHDTGLIAHLDAPTRAAAVATYADALRAVFACQAASAALSLIACAFIQEAPLPGTKEEEEEHYRRQSEGQRPGGCATEAEAEA